MSQTENDQSQARGYYIAKIEALEKNQDQIITDLKEIKEVLAERKGGTKYLFMALTIATALGGIADRILAWAKVI